MFKLYKGATRLPTFLGVPRVAAIATLVVFGIVWLVFKLWAVPFMLLIWFLEFVICKADDRMFRVLWLYTRTKGQNTIRTRIDHRRFKNSDTPSPREVWSGSSYAPISNVREDQ